MCPVLHEIKDAIKDTMESPDRGLKLSYYVKYLNVEIKPDDSINTTSGSEDPKVTEYNCETLIALTKDTIEKTFVSSSLKNKQDEKKRNCAFGVIRKIQFGMKVLLVMFKHESFVDNAHNSILDLINIFITTRDKIVTKCR